MAQKGTVEQSLLIARQLKCKVFPKDILVQEPIRKQKDVFDRAQSSCLLRWEFRIITLRLQHNRRCCNVSANQIRLREAGKDAIKRSKNGFAIATKGGMLRAKALRSDARGYFVTLADVACKKSPPKYWKCCKCGRILHGVNEIREHVAEKGREHRFVRPLRFDMED